MLPPTPSFLRRNAPATQPALRTTTTQAATNRAARAASWGPPTQGPRQTCTRTPIRPPCCARTAWWPGDDRSGSSTAHAQQLLMLVLVLIVTALQISCSMKCTSYLDIYCLLLILCAAASPGAHTGTQWTCTSARTRSSRRRWRMTTGWWMRRRHGWLHAVRGCPSSPGSGCALHKRQGGGAEKKNKKYLRGCLEEGVLELLPPL